MIISDLTYLQDISESSEVLGGSRKKGRGGFEFNVNVNKVNQYSKIEAYAVNFGKYGDAENYISVYQESRIDN